MSDFDIFNKALLAYQHAEDEKSTTRTSESEYEPCSHLKLINEKGRTTCMDCGEVIEKTISREKEWRYYGSSDTSRTSDPNRAQARKTVDRNIFKDVENMGFEDNVVSLANELYNEVTNGEIFRANSRKSIIFACIFHAFKLMGKPQSHERLIDRFRITKRTGLKGLKHVNLHAPKNSRIRAIYITPENLVDELMDKFKASKGQKDEVRAIYNNVKNRSSKLNRSRPQSVSSGMIYYWICLKKKNIELSAFADKVGLSELTIDKIAKEISFVLKTPDIVP